MMQEQGPQAGADEAGFRVRILLAEGMASPAPSSYKEVDTIRS